MNTGWREIDIHGCYLLVKINFPPICTCTKNRRILRHNTSISGVRDVIGQLWWRWNAKSEKTVLGDNGELSERWLLSVGVCVVQGIKLCVRNKITYGLPRIMIFLFTREAICQWFSLLTASLIKSIGKSTHSWPKLVIYNMPYIILCIIICFRFYIDVSCIFDATNIKTFQTETGVKDTVQSSNYAHPWPFAMSWCGMVLVDLTISFRVTTLALGQSYDCPSASEATLKKRCESISYESTMSYITITKQSTTKPCTYFMEYTLYMRL